MFDLLPITGTERRSGHDKGTDLKARLEGEQDLKLFRKHQKSHP